MYTQKGILSALNRKGLIFRLGPYRLAPQHGLEPRTQWLTATCSANWATGEQIGEKLFILTIPINQSPVVNPPSADFANWATENQNEQNLIIEIKIYVKRKLEKMGADHRILITNNQ